MTIKTLEIIHDALKSHMERQKIECEILETALNRSKEKGAPEHEIKLSEKVLKSATDELDETKSAIIEFENAEFVIGK